MGKLNGTTLLVYDNGVLIAAQRGITINLKQNLFDITTKDSAGWAEHGNGLRDADISVDGLVSTTGLSAAGLFAHIISRTSLLLVIEGFDCPLVCEADVANSSITGPQEEATTLSGSFKVKGPLYYLSDANANLITDPDGGTTDYDTLTVSGIKITSAINAAGTAYCNSNAFSVTEADVIKLFVYITKTSGQLPNVGIWDNTSAFISNEETLVEGFNLVTLTVTGSDATASLRISNSGAANFNTSNIYCFKAN